MTKSVDAPGDAAALGMINRREAIRRVGALLGGISFVGGSTLLSAGGSDAGPFGGS